MRYLVRAISTMDNLVAKATDDLDDAIQTRDKLEGATPNKTFRYEIWEGNQKIAPAETVVL